MRIQCTHCGHNWHPLVDFDPRVQYTICPVCGLHVWIPRKPEDIGKTTPVGWIEEDTNHEAGAEE